MHFLNNKNILLLGGSGFVGKSIIKLLLDSGFRVVVITRNINKIKSSKISGEPGQLEIISANIFENGVLKENIKNKFAVINLCGILYESNRDDFYKLHTFLPGYISKICKKNDISRFIHVSALGVSKDSYPVLAEAFIGFSIICPVLAEPVKGFSTICIAIDESSVVAFLTFFFCVLTCSSSSLSPILCQVCFPTSGQNLFHLYRIFL